MRTAFEVLNEKYVNHPCSTIKHVIIFTWPGRSPQLPYHYFDDKKDAIRSGEAFARGMEKVVRFFHEFLLIGRNKPCDKKIHLIAHSMAHRVLKHMMLEMKSKQMSNIELFSEIVLMAADIEYDIFERGYPFYDLIEFGERVHIYFHRRDRVLDISKYTKNFSNRLGRYGRKRIDPQQIDIFDADVTNTDDDEQYNLDISFLNHWYYYSSSEVVDDVINVINGGVSKYLVLQ